MNVIILAESLRNRDAVGNNVMQECLMLRKQGYDVHIYSANYDEAFAPYMVDRESLLNNVKKKSTVILYHHSIYWEEGGIILDAAKCQVLLRYHNITPAHFFAKYSELFATLSKQGRQQTKEFVLSGKIHHYMADSAFNADELIEYGAAAKAISVVAPFHKIHEFNGSKADPVLLESLLDGKVNVLSVGRIVPNKGLQHTISVIDRYLSYYGDDIRYNIIGGTDPHFQRYVDELHELVSRYHMSGHVFFHEKVDFEALHTYYLASHALLLMSEHEGFCLPILEAQYHKLPIIALDRCAVKKTLGDEQLVIGDIDLDYFAAAIHTVVNDNIARTYLAERGYDNYKKYRSELLDEQLLRLLHETF